MKKIMTALMAVSLCAGVAMASYADNAYQAAAPAKTEQPANMANCAATEKAALNACTGQSRVHHCKKLARKDYRQCERNTKTQQHAMNTQQPQAQSQSQQQ